MLKSVRLGRAERQSEEDRQEFNLPSHGCIAIESHYEPNKGLSKRLKHFTSFRDYLLTFGDFKDISLED